MLIDPDDLAALRARVEAGEDVQTVAVYYARVHGLPVGAVLHAVRDAA